MTKSRSRSAAEFAAELEKDPDYQKRLADRQEIAAVQGGWPLTTMSVNSLRSLGVGLSVLSVYAFVGKSVPLTPSAAAPVLVKHLSLPHMRVVREGIIRALACSHLLLPRIRKALKAGFIENH